MRGSIENDVTPCVAGQRKKRFPGRWSLRHLIYSSPILNRRRAQNASGPSKSHTKREGKDVPDSSKAGNSSKENDRHHVEIHQATSRTSVYTTSTKSGEALPSSLECPLCFAELTPEEFCELEACGHRACIPCFQQYLRVEITESRICISCPQCLEPMHPNEIRDVLDNPALFEKYEDFMVRRVLAVDPDTRWCPAPDCCFAVIASECASCPKLKCERPGCDSYFCYHCKAEWHPNQTCDAARAQRSPNIRSSSISYSQDSQHRDDIKPCPRCQVLIVKMDDGSCNHMMCAVCGAEFCWLCMKEINDLHFLSPSGCTFWGKKPWSRKKKILWQLGTLVGAPVGIALVAGITVPAMVIGIPVWVGRKLFTRYKSSGKHKRNAAIVGGVVASVLISPLLAGLAVGIGVPILLFYVYGVVPVSLCRSGGCGGSSASEDSNVITSRAADTTSMDAVSTKGPNPSIGEASLSLASGSQVLRDIDRESASTVALAGSLNQAGTRLEVQADLVSAQRFSLSSLSESVNASIADDAGASVRALAGSMLNYKAPGSDSCSCITTEDCTSERVRFDDNVSFITSSQAEKTSIGSSCSFRARCATKSALSKSTAADKISDTLSNDSICIEIDEKPKKYSSQAAILRSQFFHSINDGKPTTKSLDDKTIIEVSNETLDKQSQPLIVTENGPVVVKLSSSLNFENSKL
ncbi:E3 ubiquitin-protein ligase RNF19A-like [Diabrotica virgifera virgifera]|uniref:RBR-type E3 ubiquitin transferase n=1 Tax=Diabrotica virgifera virgifera TaxID=50390 RepID=A0A6P7H9Z5_DIAVI|nr:E3 ubiquitin-protein ligase RNF19A-like [Diabrotica virgifera virgifera]XP_028152715.1 E3 ubiquitin-protein ligase RNF19A-like [Diabrotica virgifera virgifera]XP_028152721.1 E3 ubiquitin-protein ligase RNF19A-like [Diabrotica virgifera virgifera]XP_028152727.1 E3 ubiquitin-protein ligase RNF19A-like [Diabrotica virgifera virgifera]